MKSGEKFYFKKLIQKTCTEKGIIIRKISRRWEDYSTEQYIELIETIAFSCLIDVK